MSKNIDYQDFSKTRLAQVIEKKFKTTIIGSLDHFEKEFGYLWGHGLDYDELDEEQLYFREIWNKVRTRILDDGHSNLRASKKELDQYSVHWNRYVTNFEIKR